jgi:hypothetical protein
MRRRLSALLLAVTLAASPAAEANATRVRTLAGAATQGSGASQGPLDMSEAELQGAGCLLSGSVATAAAYVANASEVAMVAAGGTLVPSSAAILGIVMLSTIFTSGCAVGAIAAPFGWWVYRQAAPQTALEPEAAAP